jgi:hypothetical protein
MAGVLSNKTQSSCSCYQQQVLQSRTAADSGINCNLTAAGVCLVAAAMRTCDLMAIALQSKMMMLQEQLPNSEDDDFARAGRQAAAAST